MPEHRSGSRSVTEPDDRQRRLADLLADMVPGAATFRVTLHDPATAWPQPHARAYGTAGGPINLNRTQAVTAARWIIRMHPEAVWGEAYVFDLATARLHPAVAVAAGRGR
ncbi:transcriptional regulator [Streptomyces sp. MNU76]|uniref:transcriptional regulator n=1 Tax=Streptomyces sp. MNU76 TaxID=2560026 RepID=UPI001E41A2B9|nr:transcriptional regulator [Streptomyces sp. MNU76]MCC9707139.1 transcriptional regulator [Streptomyces sp. MNU76]